MSEQLSLLPTTQKRTDFGQSKPTSKAFDGKTYVERRDGERLATQLEAVLVTMQAGDWHTLRSLVESTEALTGKHASEASISARIRDLRKDKFGAHEIEHRNVGGGLWEYRMPNS